jgi:hypothetical protein
MARSLLVGPPMTLGKCLVSLAIACAIGGCGGSDSASANAGSQNFSLVLAASTAPFAFDDGASGQTARHVTAGVRSLTLIADDGTEWKVFDAAPGNASVGYDDGDSTPLAELPESEIVPGHYVRARLVQDWSRFDIDVALHDGLTTTPGTLQALSVTSDGALVDGTSRNAGYYEQDFDGGGVQKHFSGDDGIVPADSTTAGAEAVVENGSWSVYFPVDLEVSGPATLRVVVNMDHAFRWTDVAGGSNQAGVYDIAPPLYEPVTQFGGNRFDATLE